MAAVCYPHPLQCLLVFSTPLSKHDPFCQFCPFVNLFKGQLFTSCVLACFSCGLACRSLSHHQAEFFVSVRSQGGLLSSGRPFWILQTWLSSSGTPTTTILNIFGKTYCVVVFVFFFFFFFSSFFFLFLKNWVVFLYLLYLWCLALCLAYIRCSVSTDE